MNKYIKQYYFLMFFLVFNSCLDDSITIPFTEPISNTAELLIEIERRGDFVNSENFPSVLDPDSVFLNLDKYIVADIRLPDEFANGHIEGAVNLSNTELLDFVKNNSGQSKNILIVCTTGQASAYYTSLLRMHGFNDTYSMNFGMSLWNGQFSDLISNLTDFQIQFGIFPSSEFYDNRDYPKADHSELPALTFENESASFGQKLEERIRLLINEDFTEKLRNNFMFSDEEYVVCFGDLNTYHLGTEGVPEFPSHPVGTAHYKTSPWSHLMSVNDLQTIPSNKIVTIYSYSGQLSAIALALLDVLGYNAKSLNYGLHSTSYTIIGGNRRENFLVFTRNKIKNYPFVTGQ